MQAEILAKNEQQRAEQLLPNILPEPIADEMKKGNDLIAQIHDEVSVLFADIVGFTELSRLLPCHDLVSRLNDVFSVFDDLSDRHGLEKIKTIGDNYMVASGLPRSVPHHAEAIADMALEMQAIIPRFSLDGVSPLALRIGIHSGPVVAGVIGRRKFTYDLWGETVNIASRMESSGLPGRIQRCNPAPSGIQPCPDPSRPDRDQGRGRHAHPLAVAAPLISGLLHDREAVQTSFLSEDSVSEDPVSGLLWSPTSPLQGIKKSFDD